MSVLETHLSGNFLIQFLKSLMAPPRCFVFETFPDPLVNGVFRNNVATLIQEYTTPAELTSSYIPKYRASLKTGRGVIVPLYIIEENLEYPYCCIPCKYSGWSGHLVAKNKYHFIIPSTEDWEKPINGDAIDMQTHLLHGSIHGNGLGHLILIKGIEGGSKFLTGREIMGLWDRICSNLRARHITVCDVAKNNDMDFKVLHGVAYGESWFTRWGYEFSHGTFGVKAGDYEKAITALGSLELDVVMEDVSLKSTKTLIKQYRDMTETDLVTFRDLFKLLLSLKSKYSSTKKDLPGEDEPTKSVQAQSSILTDLSYLYTKLLVELPDCVSHLKVVLRSVYFVKNLPVRFEKDDNDTVVRFLCRLEMVPDGEEVSCDFPPGVCVQVPRSANVADLRRAVEDAMHQTYYGMNDLSIVYIVGMQTARDNDPLSIFKTELGEIIQARGCGIDLKRDLRFQGGDDRVPIECDCGARDYDGELMMECDWCYKFNHIVCSGYKNSEEVPENFTCNKCKCSKDYISWDKMVKSTAIGKKN